jgi:hypothetical protein
VTFRVRLLLVATVCQALVGMAAVATSASWDQPPGATAKKPGRGIALGVDGNRGTALADAGGGDGSAAEPGALSTAIAAGTDGGSGTTATTAAHSGGTTSTTTKGSTTTTTAGPGGPECPNAKTCDIYKIIDQSNGGPSGGTKGWRPDPDGIVRINFYVNPTPPAGSGLTEDTMEAAFLAGTKIIEAANPRIKYEYQGRTDRVPRQFDGFNDFQFGDGTRHSFDRDGYIYEADILPRATPPAGTWAYTPCEQWDGTCGDSGNGKFEIMNTIVHEEMHSMGLADLPVEPATSELTMNPSGNAGPGNRFRVTLGLGDVLGLRALYPTSAPMPPIYAP